VWEEPPAAEIEALRRRLTAGASRSLVFGAHQDPVWLWNFGGDLKWLSPDGRPADVSTRFGRGPYASIDLDADAQLTGPAVAVARAAGTRTGFCELGLGADLSSVLGWNGGL
jgi:hypothetical protein